LVCKSGAALNFDEEKAKEILKEDEVRIKVDFNQEPHPTESGPVIFHMTM